MEQLQQHNPRILATAQELAADKGYDSMLNNASLYQDFGMKPVIDIRSTWKEHPDQPRVLFGHSYDVSSYDEQVNVSCTCPVTDERRAMFFHGFEKDRSTLKYRCPAAALGLTCQGRNECESLAPKGVAPLLSPHLRPHPL